MPGTWYTSDPHLHHRLVAGVRGFDSVDAHDSEIIRRWNKAVAPEDTVWLLGDVGMGDDENAYLGLASCLNGIKHLISGNHDAVWPGHQESWKHMDLWLAVFETIQPFARRRINRHEVLLSHFPYDASTEHHPRANYNQYRLRDEGRWLLHGHTHGTERLHGHQIHVGLDAWDLRPVNEGTIGRLIAESGE